MTLLSIVQKSAIRCGWANKPSSAISNNGPQALDIQQMIAFAQDAGQEMLEEINWAMLDKAGSITGDGTTTIWTLPTDWQRISPSELSPEGAFVSSKYPLAPLLFPVNTEHLNMLKALPASTVRPVGRIIGNSMEWWPALSAGEVLTFNYYSKYWITSGVTPFARQAEWASDLDTAVFSEDCIMKYCTWRWKESKGLDYAEAFRMYERALPRAAAQQNTVRTISMSRQLPYRGPTPFFGTITDNSTH